MGVWEAGKKMSANAMPKEGMTQKNNFVRPASAGNLDVSKGPKPGVMGRTPMTKSYIPGFRGKPNWDKPNADWQPPTKRTLPPGGMR